MLAQVANAFRPEFLGRLDCQIVFRKLDYSMQIDIARLNLAMEEKFLAERGCQVTFDEEVLTSLLRVGFDKYLGARPLKKAMEKYIRAPLAVQKRYSSQKLNGKFRVDHPRACLRFSLTVIILLPTYYKNICRRLGFLSKSQSLLRI